MLPPETLLAAGASKASAPAPPGEAGAAADAAVPGMMPGAVGAAACPAAAAAAMMPGGDWGWLDYYPKMLGEYDNEYDNDLGLVYLLGLPDSDVSCVVWALF